MKAKLEDLVSQILKETETAFGKETDCTMIYKKLDFV